MPQGNLNYIAKNPSNVAVPLSLDATGKLKTALPLDAQGSVLFGEGNLSSLNITAATAVKATPGRLVRINVTVAGAAGTANDCATTGAAAAGNVICAIPAVVGVINVMWPCNTGIVIVPGAAQVVSVSYS